jgi:tetratricopeptide (TPR) repeat protein
MVGPMARPNRCSLAWLLVFLFGLLMVAPRSAYADDGTPTTGEAFDKATPKQSNQAKALYQEGLRYDKAKKYAEALEKFRASYGVVKSPNSRLMIVKTLVALDRLIDAYEESLELVDEAKAAAEIDKKKYDKTVAESETVRDDIRGKIALVTVKVTADKGAVVKLDDEPLDEADWNKPLPKMPGEIVAELEGAPSKTVQLEAGGEATIELALPKKKAKKQAAAPKEKTSGYDGPDRITMAIIAGGAGGGFLILFGVFGGLTLSEYDEVEQGCEPDPDHCEGEYRIHAERGEAYQALANISLTVGILGVAAGGGFLLWEFLDDGEGDKGDARIVPQVGPGYAGIGGRF